MVQWSNAPSRVTELAPVSYHERPSGCVKTITLAGSCGALVLLDPNVCGKTGGFGYHNIVAVPKMIPHSMVSTEI